MITWNDSTRMTLISTKMERPFSASFYQSCIPPSSESTVGEVIRSNVSAFDTTHLLTTIITIMGALTIILMGACIRVILVSALVLLRYVHDLAELYCSDVVLEEVTVTDFDFVLDLSVILRINPNPEIWTLDHTVPGYRGSMYKEVLQIDDPNEKKKTNFWKRLGQRIRGRNRGQVRLPDNDLESNDTKEDLIKWRAATRKERRRLDNFSRWRATWGLAPWTPMSAYQEYDTEDVQYPVSAHPSMTVRQWADDYCHSQKIMKEFNFKKVMCFTSPSRYTILNVASYLRLYTVGTLARSESVSDLFMFG